MLFIRFITAVLSRGLVVSLSLACLPSMVVLARQPSDQTDSESAITASPAPRRSHIQPVGEVAVSTRNPDTLGLRLSRASDVLRQQLALSRGAGLVVEDVVVGSVADTAGFKQHDVLVLLDDQLLLLPEQLAALLETSDGGLTQCTLLRGGVKVKIPLGESGRTGQPILAKPTQPVGLPILAAAAAPLRQPAPAIRQTAGKPSTSPRLRTPASALALVQTGKQSSPLITKTSGSALTQDANHAVVTADETLFRHDPDYQIKLSRGEETRLVVLDPRGRIVFNDEIDTPKNRSLVPQAVRQRVDEMENSLEPVTSRTVVEIGRLDTDPIEIR